jgi:RNA polymerase sigma-32 factor
MGRFDHGPRVQSRAAQPTDRWLVRYLVNIERYPILDREAELELARRHREGDTEASELLIGAHLRAVVQIARRYTGYGHSLVELIGEGNLGLVIALERFEPERELRFMTYASYWVRAEILEFVMSSWSVVGVGKSSLATRLFFGLAREQGRLEAYGYDTRDLREALAASFGCSPERIDRMRERLSQRDLIDDRATSSPGFDRATSSPGLFDERDPERSLLSAERVVRSHAQLGSALANLDERERTVIEQRVLGEARPSLVELGRQLGISRERVRQIEARARAKLAAELAEFRPEA